MCWILEFFWSFDDENEVRAHSYTAQCCTLDSLTIVVFLYCRYLSDTVPSTQSALWNIVVVIHPNVQHSVWQNFLSAESVVLRNVPTEQSYVQYFSVRVPPVVLHIDLSLKSVASLFFPSLSSAKRLSEVLQLSITDPGTVWLHQRSHAYRWAA